MSSEIKELYEALKSEGVLKEFYGKRMTGNWEKDEKTFTEMYQENEKLFGLESINLDEYENEEDDFG